MLATDGIYDVAVVGSGAAGYSAAVQAAWAGLSTLVFQSFEAGGQLMLSDRVENYPGLGEGTTGPDLADAMEEQAIRLGAEVCLDHALRVDLSGRPFRLWAEREDEPTLDRTVIVATGAKARWLGVEGEQRLIGRGVSECATCDAFFFRGKRVAVVGGGDRAMEEALFLARFAREVVVVHRRDGFRASRTLLGRARGEPRISFLTGTAVEEVLGDHSVEGMRVRDARTGAGRILDVDGLFVAVGYEPHLGPFAGLLETDVRAGDRVEGSAGSLHQGLPRPSPRLPQHALHLRERLFYGV
ncbi:MAG: FAD-dependent oxidoreductase, partial [Actinomycetota bacterium]|nr:FAD-dependent oxidoreductase [Actinomycetota bacterium]